ncbi:MAG: glycosyltransferase [Desulfuromonadales bacterium]
MENFLYSVSRPHIIESLLSSFDIQRLKVSESGIKLMSLGALLASGRLEQCIQVADLLNFGDISITDRRYLSIFIFDNFREHCAANPRLAKSILHILMAVSPESMLPQVQSTQYRRPVPLLKLDYAHTINPTVKGAVFFREFLYGEGSRRCEAGHRIQNALASQGWDVSFFPLQDVHQHSSGIKNDFVMVDVTAFFNMSLDDISDVLTGLRRFYRKIIIIDVDVWSGAFDDMLRSISGCIDHVWVFTADWCMEADPALKEQCIVFPCMGGFDTLDNINILQSEWSTCSFNFTGSVQGYSPGRMYWLLEAMCRELPIVINITDPTYDDGIDPIQSQHKYAEILASTHASINLTTRRDGSRPATGRAFETLSLNRLLVQESCPVFHRYFVEGEHFIEFSDIEGLSTAIDFFRSHPKAAQTISTQGHQFYRDRYSCRKLVEHIQTFI